MLIRCFLIILLGLLFTLPAAAEPTLLLATDDTPGPPFIIGEGAEFHWEKPGIEIELFQLMAAKLNLSVKFIRLPWKRCLLQLEQGKIDGIFPASFKKKRMQFGVYPMKNGQVNLSLKMRDNAYFLYKHKQSPLLWDGDGFSGVQNGIYAPLGWAIVDDLKKMKTVVHEVYDLPRVFKLLENNRIDGFACLETVADYYLNENPEQYSNIEKLYPPLKEKPYYLMLSHPFVKQHPQLADKIWRTIVEIKESDAYKTIIQKYQTP